MNVATVVGVENDDGFIGNTLVIKCIEQCAYRFIQGMHHRCIRGRLLFLPALDLLAVTLNQFRLGPKGCVHRELPVVYEERLGAVSVLEPSDSLFCHAIFDVLARRAFRKGRIWISPWRQVTSLGTGAMPMRKINIKSMFQRGETLHPQMPLTEMSGGIASLFQNLTKSRHNRIDPRRGLNIDAFLVRQTSGLGNRLKANLR